MTQTFFIKPASDAKVRDPITKQHLRAEGESKPRTNYWLRRVASGEVVIANERAAEPKTFNVKKGGE
ncbi:MAG: DUF2635 domain-containing protein [Novosphingobium sp.]